MSALIKIAAFSQMFSNSSDSYVLKMTVGVRKKSNGLRSLSAVLGQRKIFLSKCHTQIYCGDIMGGCVGTEKPQAKTLVSFSALPRIDDSR